MRFYLAISVIFLTAISCSRKTYSGNMYLVGYDSQWDSSEDCYQFIKNQAIPKTFMKDVQYGTELIIEENKVITIYDFNYGRRSSKKNFTPFALRFDRLNSERNTPYSIHRGSTGESHLGGIKPPDLNIPRFNDEIAFQYFGSLTKEEFPNEILTFDLHLVAPIYDAFTELYMDYGNPLSPKIINGVDARFERTFDEMDAKSVITFVKTNLEFRQGGSLRYGLGYTGVPSWIQGPMYPKCPYSGEEMTFLASFDMAESKEQIVVEEMNFDAEERSRRYFEKLEFWISGSIYIFINPKTKTVCYFLQTT